MPQDEPSSGPADRLFSGRSVDLRTIPPEYLTDHRPERRDRWIAFAFERLREEYGRYRQAVQTLAYATMGLNAVGATLIGGVYLDRVALGRADVPVPATLVYAGFAFVIGLLFGFLFCMLTAYLLDKCFRQYNARTMAFLKGLITDRDLMYQESRLERGISSLLAVSAFISFVVGVLTISFGLLDA